MGANLSRRHFTPDQVVAIRTAPAGTLKELCSQCGWAYTSVFAIRQGRSYKDVPMPQTEPLLQPVQQITRREVRMVADGDAAREAHGITRREVRAVAGSVFSLAQQPEIYHHVIHNLDS